MATYLKHRRIITLVVVLTAGILPFSGCTSAQLAPQDSVMRSGVTLENAATAPRGEPWRPVTPTASAIGSPDIPIATREMREPVAPPSFSPPRAVDQATVEETFEVAQRTVMRVTTDRKSVV